MPTLAEIRQQFPQYDDLSDEQLADGLHRKFYSDLPKDEFLAKIGVASTDPYEADAQKLADQIEATTGKAGAGSLFKDSFSLGLSDKVGGVVGGVGSLVKGEGFGKGYNTAQRAEEIVLERARERSGGAGTAASIGGSLATGALAKAPAAATWAARALQAGKEGAVLGAGQGIGDAGGSLGEMATGAVTGGIIGAATGGAASSVLDAGAAAARGVGHLGRAAGRMMDDPQERAVRMVNEKLQADDMTANQAAARMRRSQADQNAPNLTLMDTADENVKGLAAAASAQPGPGRRVINRYVDQRAAGQPARTVTAASDALGDPNAFKQTTEQLAQTRSAHGNQAYGAAWKTAKPVGGVDNIIMDLDARIPSAKGSIQGTLQRMRGLLMRKGTMGEMPERDLRSLHEAKLELDNMLSGGSETSLGNVQRREIAKVRRQLLDAMDAASPEYAGARKTFADESALMNALENGRRFLREDVDDLADQMATMGPAEREMFQQGAVREIRNIVESAPDGTNVVKRVFSSPAKRSALRSVFQNDKEFRAFQNSMLRELQAARTRDVVGVRRGSRTAVLQADQQAASGLNEALGVVADVAGAGGAVTAGNVANRTAQGLAKVLRDRSGMSPEVAEQVAKIMVQENPQEVVRLLSMGPKAAPRPLPGQQPGVARRYLPAGIGSTASQLVPR
jgi:hypothetical protein